MNCDECRDLILTDHLDGELSDARQREVLDHAAACPECRALLQEASRALVDPFRNLARPEPPPELWNRIAGELDLDPGAETVSAPRDGSVGSEAGSPGRWRTLLPALVVACVCLLFAIGGLAVWSHLASTPSPAVPARDGQYPLRAMDGAPGAGVPARDGQYPLRAMDGAPGAGVSPSPALVGHLLDVQRLETCYPRILADNRRFGTAVEKIFFPAELFPRHDVSK